MSVTIFVDAACDISWEIAKDNNIIVVPLGFSFRYKKYYDIKSISNEYREYMNKYGLEDKIPIRKDYLKNKMRMCISEGNDILFISSSSSLSNSYKMALEASKEFDSKRVRVIDSKSVGSGLTLLCIYAKKYIDEGNGLKQTYNYIEELKSRVCCEYLLEDAEPLFLKLTSKFPSSYTLCYKRVILVGISKGKLHIINNFIDYELGIDEMINKIYDNIKFIDNTYFVIGYSKKGNRITRFIDRVKRITRKSVNVFSYSKCMKGYCGDNSVSIAYIK